jgi:hypothetical protein
VLLLLALLTWLLLRGIDTNAFGAGGNGMLTRSPADGEPRPSKRRTGSPSSRAARDRAAAVRAAPGEVRVHLKTSGVNPSDWKSRSGRTAPMHHSP